MAATGGPRNRNPREDADADENLVFETSAGVEVISSFDQMGIREDLLRGIYAYGFEKDLLRGIYAYGFEKPSAIQQRAVMPIITGRDAIAQAQSGTGKTSMIALAVCQMIDTATREFVSLPRFCRKRLSCLLFFFLCAVHDICFSSGFPVFLCSCIRLMYLEPFLGLRVCKP